VRALGVVLDSCPLHNTKGTVGMSHTKLHLPLPTTFIFFVTATGSASQLRCGELAEQTGRRQAAQR
jgi:hypothetical protein